jgi:predicted nucleic acid-binding protein
MPAATQDVVADCSITLPWYFEDETSELADKLLNLIGHATIWVPAMWRLEFVNALIAAERRGRMTAQKRVQILEHAQQLPLRTDTEMVPMHKIADIAVVHGLTSYDATYFELAQRRGLTLATLDRQLLSAARNIKHPVFT